jgi:uncharacterized protein YecT (DUF1311 family)
MRVRFHQVIAAAALMLLCAVATGHAEKRVALVIGNAAYRHADRLANPVNDARSTRDALAQLGFDVIYGEDLDQKGLRRTIGQFADRVGDADVAMVYFAGHGATFGDTPYVVPVDAEFSSLGQVAYELVPVETLIGELRQAKGVRIVILDACRDNAAEQELKRQSSRGGPTMRGLAPMKNSGGLIIAYATQYLSTAADDAGGRSSTGHSPFTAALLNNIATPGLDVKEMFFKVGSEVDAATGGKQRPEISISMYGQYALARAAGTGRTTAAPPLATERPVSEVAQAFAMVEYTTSFKCATDRHPDEVTICGNSALATLDRRMSDLYFIARQRLDPTQQPVLQNSQRAWLRQRAACERDADCISRLYQQRIQELSALAAP